MKRLFITGIPTSGKSYLGKKLAQEVNGIYVELDAMRESLSTDEKYRKWIHFYLDQDEHVYYTNTTFEEQWNNLVNQSEALWPVILDKINEYNIEEKPIIFEGVNILPHLAHRDLSFQGIVLLGTSYEETLKRNIKEPRWGKTKELQEFEADGFFNGERPRYKAEAEKYGYQTFQTAEEAFQTALDMLV